MDISTNYGFFLPSRDTDDIADINQISDNFRKIDGKMQDKFAEVTLQNEILTLTSQNSLRIRNLADPILDNDAVNKKYLETILEQKFSEFVNVSEVGQ